MGKGIATIQTVQSLAAADLAAVLNKLQEALVSSETREDVYTELTDALDAHVKAQRDEAYYDGIREGRYQSRQTVSWL